VKQLSWTDAAFIRMDQPNRPAHVNPVLIYDPSGAPRPVTYKGILAAIDSRLHQAPSFRRRLVDLKFGLAAPYWIEDPDFDLEYHVRHIALPKPGDWRQLCIQVARLHARPLDLTRPPWELTVIEGLDAVQGLAPGCFALSLKVHHSAIDGVEGVELITAIHDLVSDAPPPEPPREAWQPDRVPSTVELISRASWHGIRHPLQIGRVATRHLPGAARGALGAILARRLPDMSAPKTRFNGTLGQNRVFECRFHEFADVRTIKAAVPGATVNDVALAYVGGALRHYLTAHGELPEASLVAMCPISTRTQDQVRSGGNMLSMMRQSVGSDIADPLSRLAAIAEATGADRIARKGVGAPALLEVAELLPGALIGVGLRATELLPGGAPVIANLTLTNVPGSRVPLFFCGARLVRTTGNGPLAGGVGLMHLVNTYVGDFTVALTADRKMLPDPAFYAECMDRSFDELLAAALSSSKAAGKGVTSATS
jgi:diacylglycerol O-acyltransferase